MNASPAFIAATVSPRRHVILKDLGVEFTVFKPDTPEINDTIDAVHTVSVNALAKHAAAAALHPDAWILAADTIVEFEGRAVGKPTDRGDAHRMLLAFSGKPQTVLTAVAMSTPRHGPDLRIAASSVVFRKYGPGTVAEYLKKADTCDRAGAYDIATCSDMIVASYTGSYTNIMGLPAEVVSDWLRANGFPMRTAVAKSS